ncbi:type IV secretory system conjugative DNA transfer family protein [Rothia sp. ZJ932]|uniref:type IV secretory system conjugative DNA transfer family protein n=1 Tax=Rothia sp. ZJ932 TaxID=2810516 RepID=UPI00196817D4|nr:type IV secretory system conjugative DNA transfer family protein [Rothia sp. ZJ932]QRZ61794.1 type IV secretory system conjugative DNA transfer family protein [Rothia sp. ZJ932]
MKSRSTLFLVILLVGFGGIWLALQGGAYLGGTVAPSQYPLAGLLEVLTGRRKANTYTWVFLALVLLACIFLISQWPKEENSANQFKTKYKDVASSLGHDAALKAARETLINTLPPSDPDPAQARKDACEFVNRLPENYLIYSMGTLTGEKIYGEAKESKLVLAPTQAGKTATLGSNFVLDAAGAVIATSTKADLLMITAIPRAAKGKVYAFDLDDISGWKWKVKWNPVIGCENFEVALRRGQAWAGAKPMGNVKGGDWFSSKAAAVLGRLLHVAAISTRDLGDVIRWSNNLRNPEPMELLRAHADKAAPGVLGYLQATADSRAGETIDSIQQTLSDLLEPLSPQRILQQLVCPAEESFSIREFLEEANTIYLISDTATGIDTGPLVSMFANEVVNEARDLSQEKFGGRLWPAFRAVLDEAPNLAAFPKMDSIMSDINGRGVEVILIGQAESQLEDRWGKEAARTIKGNSVVKYYLPGLELETMKPVAEAMGKYDKRKVTTSHASGRTGTSRSYTSERRNIAEAYELTQLPRFTAMVHYKNFKPMHVKLTPWWLREDAKTIKEGWVKAHEICGKASKPFAETGLD